VTATNSDLFLVRCIAGVISHVTFRSVYFHTSTILKISDHLADCLAALSSTPRKICAARIPLGYKYGFERLACGSRPAASLSKCALNILHRNGARGTLNHTIELAVIHYRRRNRAKRVTMTLLVLVEKVINLRLHDVTDFFSWEDTQQTGIQYLRHVLGVVRLVAPPYMRMN
jgi:hypothetical protein